MEIVDFILINIPTLIECFILWRLLTFVLKLNYGRKTATVAAAGMLLLVLLKQMMGDYPSLEKYQGIGSFIVLIYIIAIIFFLTSNKFTEKLVWLGIFTLGDFVIELALLMGYSAIIHKSVEQIANIGTNNYLAPSIMKLITLLIFEIIFRKHKGKINIGVSYFWELAMVITFNMVLVLVLVFTFFNRKDIIDYNEILAVISGMVLIITGYTVILIFRIERKSNDEIATQLKLQQIELELKLNNEMVDITDKLRKLRHDMNNHIGLIKTLVETGKYEELKEYVDQIYEDVEVANELVITNNKTLSILLNAKRSLAREKNIDFSSVITARDLNMKSKDICSLLGNILDNAIEAAEKSGSKKYIQLMIQNTENGCVINCENSIGMKPIMKKGRLITNKENTLIHGIGTENIKDIVAKYHGELEFEYDDEAFNVHVLLPV